MFAGRGMGWEMFLANPIFGVGQAIFPWTIGEYLGGRTWQTRSLSGRQAHSLYFTLLPGIGAGWGGDLWCHGVFQLSEYKDKDVTAVSLPCRPPRPGENATRYASRACRFIWQCHLGGMMGYLTASPLFLRCIILLSGS